jgi:hypothetical protein
MRKLLVSAVFVIAVAGIGWAADHDRHATFTDPKTPSAPAQCKGFYATDDNLTPCNDFCAQYRTDNSGAACACDDGKCPADDH